MSLDLKLKLKLTNMAYILKLINLRTEKGTEREHKRERKGAYKKILVRYNQVKERSNKIL